MVTGDIIEELLISINRIGSNMETVMLKIENMENVIKETEANVKTLNNEVKLNSKQNILILEQLGTLKEDVKNGKEEQNLKHLGIEP